MTSEEHTDIFAGHIMNAIAEMKNSKKYPDNKSINKFIQKFIQTVKLKNTTPSMELFTPQKTLN